MEHEINLPFKVGQVAETKSFEKGYRGAWFQCKIKDISKKKGRLGHVLEYIYFPEEKLRWTMLYQVTFHHEGDTKGKHRELMLRPAYPPIYKEKQMPHVSEISEVTVIVGDSWRVGDLVDWWTTDCYWSGTITQILGPNKAQIELKPPPLGEGFVYKVLFKDLRPSLDWSPELGWTVPTQEGDTGCPCARLVKPINQGREAEGVQKSAGLFFPSPASSTPAVSDEAMSRTTETQTQTVSVKRKDKQERSTSQGPVDSSTRKTSQVVADSGQNGAAMKSRTTEMQIRSLGKTVSEKWKDKRERNTPVDSSTRNTSRAVADSGQNGAEVKSRTTEMQACSLGKTVSEKRKDRQERSTSQGPVGSSTRKTSRVVADSGQNGAAMKSRTAKMQTRSLGKAVSKKRKDRQERSTSQGPVDSSPRKTSGVVADSGQHGAEPAAEVSVEELIPDSCQEKYRAVLNSKRSDTLEAAVVDLEEYVNKVKWLKKILQHGISSSDDQGPQWEFMEPLAALKIPK